MLFLVGCGSQNSQSVQDAPVEAVPIRVSNNLQREVQDALANISDSDLKAFSLISAERRLSIGDSERSAFETFTKSREAFESTKPPPKLATDLLKARSWEDDRQGFGVLTRDGRVLFAMRTVTGANREDIDEDIAMYRGAFGTEQLITIEGRQVSYWFWEGTLIRLMICVDSTAKGSKTITIALGLNAIMDSLRMNRIDAPKDLAAAEGILEKSTVPR